jgi:ATP-dependent DNA helicase RecQ
LHLHAFAKGDSLGIPTRKAVLGIAREHRGQSGIVYCLSRKTVEKTAEFLSSQGVRAAFYHAGMEPDARARTQDAFQNDEVEVVCATIAFGMGIDKSNVRFVIHQDMPRSIEGYYQELGRAGRDGLESDCVLFYSWSDVLAYDRFADASEDAAAGERLRAQAREVLRMAEARSCRHAQLAGYFGEELGACDSSCDVCASFDLLERARAKLRGGERMSSTRLKERTELSEATAEGSLFAALRALRREIARERKVPPYVVFSDATLLQMAERKPTSAASLMAISGVGPVKLEHYGERFLRAITGHEE